MPALAARLIGAVGLALILLAGFMGLVHSEPVSAPLAPGSPSPAGASGNLDSTSYKTFVQFELVANGFDRPTDVAAANDGTGRLFVAEKAGVIKIISNSVVLTPAFLDIAPLINSDGAEQGLLGIVFDPNYASNGNFYVNYTDKTGVGNTVVARYAVSSTNPSLANPASAHIVLTITQPYPAHNGGDMAFGLDGYLYIATGDGGGEGDPSGNAQNTYSLLGKILRIGGVASAPTYTIPADNPYASSGGAGENWLIGLRHPWRFSFDRLTGDMYVGDVGKFSWEEIDYFPAGSPGGGNFGWNCKEATDTQTTVPPCDNAALLATLIDPIGQYAHSGNQAAVIGGYVYRGSAYPAWYGRYFYVDLHSGRMWTLRQSGSPTWALEEAYTNRKLGVTSFGEGEDGELYVADYGVIGAVNSGSIYRLTDHYGPGPHLAGSDSAKFASTAAANPGETVTYTLRLQATGAVSDSLLVLTDTVPMGLAYVPGSLTATQGVVTDALKPTLRWQGPLGANAIITVTYQATVTGIVSGSLINRALVTGSAVRPITFTHGLIVPRPVLTTTAADFFLPGTQPNTLIAEIPAPSGCDYCHSEPIYDRWRGSMMSQSGRDPLMWSALAIANQDAPNAGEYCLRCHAPGGWLQGRSAADGSALQLLDTNSGVSCGICHRLVDALPTGSELITADNAVRGTINPAVPITRPGDAMMIVDPQERRRGPFTLTIPYHPASRTDLLGQGFSAVTESRLCGTCHNVDNPALTYSSTLGQYWPNPTNQAATPNDPGQVFPLERTFDEWLHSTYAAGGVYAPQFAGSKPGGVVRSCQDCHMRRSIGAAADSYLSPVNRDCVTTGCLPEHVFVGGNTWVPQILQDTRWRLHASADSTYLSATVSNARDMLQKAATLTVTLGLSGTDRIASVRVINETGHKLPTGYPEGRRMWINLQAYDLTGTLVYESGDYDTATAILAQDAAIKVYEIKLGLTPQLAAVVGEAEGESFHFVLNNKVEKDNRIPPRGYTLAAFNEDGLRPVQAAYADGQYWADATYVVPAQTIRVIATLYYQTASKEYIDFLRANGGADGATLGALWDALPSPPEIIASTQVWAIRKVYLPLVLKQH